MDIIDSLTAFFQKPEEETKDKTPEGICALCWGYQKYDGKIRTLLKDKQIDVNNHLMRYTMIKDFVVNHIDGIKLKESLIEPCEDCNTTNQLDE